MARWKLFWFVSFIVYHHYQVGCENQSARLLDEDPIDTSREVLGSKFIRDDLLVLVSTLEGNLIAINKRTGIVKWMLEDEPVIKLSKELSKTFNLLPDPKDGSLYMLGNSGTEALTKLPFTIPELVSASPSQSSDGMLYMGKKLDTWFVIDPLTGEKQEVLSFQGLEAACPRNKPLGPSIFIGRTEYSLILLDSRTRERHWNVTYFDYTSSTLGQQDPQEYDLAHFTTSSTGKILTLDRHSGDLLWQNDFNSPIVGMYSLIHDISNPYDSIGLMPIPFTSLSTDTLKNLASKLRETSEQDRRITGDTKLFQALYIGQYKHGLYAFPSLVDDRTTFVASQTGRLLLEGPDRSTDATETSTSSTVKSPISVNLRLPSEMKIGWADHDNTFNNAKPPLTLFGHYKVPESGRLNAALQIAEEDHAKGDPDPTDEKRLDGETVDNMAFSSLFGFSVLYGLAAFAPILVVFAFSLGVFKGSVWKSFEKENQRDASFSPKQENIQFSTAVELKNGFVQVGKMLFNPVEILGKGCDGTFVYKGLYDSRDVAVKRLLPECFMVADREVALLRESDAHPNVIRYFCTEQDRQFKYIALELCEATLQDYVEGRYASIPIDGVTILRHATAGLAHLHSLDIVHRDIKPPNVLISTPNAKGEIRAMISDFGLCKKLKIGRMSFSRRSGVAGTEGWIAPEMMLDENAKRTTCAVDIFSLGLVYFYVLSKGQHPFGDVLRRQANILAGEYDLSVLLYNVSAHTLIEKMLSIDPLERPPARAILKHPIFWAKEKVLAFFQDVSDRVEKDSTESAVLQSLERAAHDVVRGSWRTHLEDVVMEDLRRHRTYQGRSVRDLLRALRNKKNHYREVSEEVRRVMGRNPEEYCDYWTSRFPKLLMHSWYAMHCVKNEHIFSRYYDKQYDFIQKYIVWPTPKPKTDFHRALETAFPVYDPLFPKAKLLSEPAVATKVDDDDNVPESWDMEIEEPGNAGTPCKETESADKADTEEVKEAQLAHANQETHMSTNLIATDEVPLHEKDTDDNIVLSPGGQWGLLNDRTSNVLRAQGREAADFAPRVAAWSLPTRSQQWEFSEITHHGRKKQKSLQRKKKKKVGE
ncbi:serine/threonine-protein kinase/endoribonuclease IRE1-like [Daphnia carinata]|uniref:serine/threonine-protein kinase/endoribonuclease IRE1-like n=1 Tax=Daphnia carinata TaxID=120202 RepID=UPI00258027FA|nr:serine/threonine-protein kinase/endoribonuclease IRE1-like [Daphnia carinata]